MPGTCNERSIDLSVSATGFSPIEAYSQTDRRTLADISGEILALGHKARSSNGLDAESFIICDILVLAAGIRLNRGESK